MVLGSNDDLKDFVDALFCGRVETPQVPGVTTAFLMWSYTPPLLGHHDSPAHTDMLRIKSSELHAFRLCVHCTPQTGTLEAPAIGDILLPC
jgi:hypothetical protein